MTPLAANDPNATWAVVWFLGTSRDPDGHRWSVSSYGVSYWGSESEAKAYAETRTGKPNPGSVAFPLPLFDDHTADLIAERAFKELACPLCAGVGLHHNFGVFGNEICSRCDGNGFVNK